VLFSGQSDGTALAWDLAKVPHGEPSAVALQPADLAALWSDLGSADAVKAYHAISVLEASPKQAVPYVQEHLRPGPSAEEQRLAKLITDLDNEEFAVREQATDDLAKLGRQAEGALRKVLDGKPSADMRRRVQQLLEKLPKDTRPEPGPVSEDLQALRAVEVLEGIGTDEARQVLEELAKGPPDARLIQEAKAALGRLGK
jgi:HEAT repeat protein